MSDVVLVTLSRGYSAIIDVADEQAVNAFKWHVIPRTRTQYAARNIVLPDGRRTTVALHTFLTGFAITDHLNGNGLDNRRFNLRNATAEQNGRNVRLLRTNTSGYKGVSWVAAHKRWESKIYFNGRKKYLGEFHSKEQAAKAYDEAARAVYGEFATLNFPRPGEMPARRALDIAEQIAEMGWHR